MNKKKYPIIVLISGNGSNLQAIIDFIDLTNSVVYISAVISNNPNAYGLERAKQANIPTEIINHQDYPSRVDFDHILQLKIQKYPYQLIVLAGFMRILTEQFVSQF